MSATADSSGLTAEFALAIDASDVANGGDWPMTALLQATSAQPHPALGHGLLLRLSLPLEGNAKLTNDLNLLERWNPAGHHLGAWCADDEWGVTYVTFVPAAAYKFNLLESLSWHWAARAASVLNAQNRTPAATAAGPNLTEPMC